MAVASGAAGAAVRWCLGEYELRSTEIEERWATHIAMILGCAKETSAALARLAVFGRDALVADAASS